MHTEYDRVREALQAALREVCLDESVEIEGPNRLGGFRLNDGRNRVALSYVPSRQNDNRNWWVSAWMEVEDEWTLLLAPEDALIAGRREATMKRPLTREDAIIAALQILIEMRVRAAWRAAREAAPTDGGIFRPAEDVLEPAAPPREASTLPLAASTDLVFRTARSPRKANGLNTRR
jgi:hypothetical protein